MMRRGLILATAWIAAGCGGSGDEYNRQPVRGSVTLGGQPLASGMITFTPTTAPEPVATAIIQGGSYAIPRAEGLSPGLHRVTIWSRQPTGKQIRDPYDPETLVEETLEVVPERYNLQTELNSEVTDGGDNTFVYDLQARTAPSRTADRGGLNRSL